LHSSTILPVKNLDLKRAFPNADGFSTSNLWYMKKWFVFYTKTPSSEKLQRPVGEFPQPKAPELAKG
jgi:hypothetical protein